jgi:glycosyltransferase 2 family protein
MKQPIKKIKKFLLPLKIFISVGLLVFLFYKLKTISIYETISSINLLSVVMVILLLFAVLIIGTLNIYILIRTMNFKVSFYKMFGYFLVSWSLGSFLPGKMGEFYILPLLKKEGIGYGQSMAFSVIDKLLTFVCLAILTLIAFFLFLPMKDVLGVIIGIVVVLFLFLLLISNKTREIIKKYFLRRYAHKFQGFSKTLFFLFKKRKQVLILNLGLTVLKWFLSALSFFIIFKAFGAKVSLVMVFLLTASTTLLSFVPITMSGLGLRESVGVYLYSFLNVDKIITFSNYILMDIRNYLPAVIILIIFLFIKNKKQRTKIYPS